VRRTKDSQASPARLVSALGFLSTRVAGANGESPLRDEEERIRRACARRRWPLVEVVRESDSDDGRLRRPALEYALQRLGDGDASCLVVTRLDALCHSVADLGVVVDELQRCGARLLCIEPEIDTTGEVGRTVMRALIAVSHRERERLGERTRKGLLTARRQRPNARPALEDRPELKQLIVGMRERGMTLQAIADALNEAGVPTLRGGVEWRPSSVHAATGYKRPHAGGS
jgi:DNA invertase Pin-like site-specific DNA recombinase